MRVHSQTDISRPSDLLGFSPRIPFAEGLARTVEHASRRGLARSDDSPAAGHRTSRRRRPCDSSDHPGEADGSARIRDHFGARGGRDRTRALWTTWPIAFRWLRFASDSCAANSARMTLRRWRSSPRCSVRVDRTFMHTHAAKAGALGRLAAVLSGRRTPRVVVHTFHGHVLSGYFSRPVATAFTTVERTLARRASRACGRVPRGSRRPRSASHRAGEQNQRGSPRLRPLALRRPSRTKTSACGGISTECRHPRRCSGGHARRTAGSDQAGGPVPADGSQAATKVRHVLRDRRRRRAGELLAIVRGRPGAREASRLDGPPPRHARRDGWERCRCAHVGQRRHTGEPHRGAGGGRPGRQYEGRRCSERSARR